MYKKILFFLLFIFGIFILFYLWLFSGKKIVKEPVQITIPTPTSISIPFNSRSTVLDITTIPTLSQEQNGGVDTNSPVVKESQNQIQKIYPFLPYETTFTTSVGRSISITIPAKNLQDNSWSLIVYIFGIDYQTPQKHNDYENMKISFKEGSTYVIKWLREHDVDINKIFIVWGDKLFIQERSEQWLQEK